MIESHPIPEIAKTAMALTERDFQRASSAIADQTVAALGLDSSVEWLVDFIRGVVTREIPDPPKPAETIDQQNETVTV